MTNPKTLTFQQAQQNQPWTVPYSAAIDEAAKGAIPHILATHTVLHAAKTIGKLAAVFEELDHSRDVGEEGKSEPLTQAHIDVVKAMSANLVTEALRFANLYDFDLATVLIDRTREKNGTGFGK